MKITLKSVLVEDQVRVRRFYTEVLGFVTKHEIPMGALVDHCRITRVPRRQLSLEPDEHPVVGPFKQALFEDGIPLTSFSIAGVVAEHQRLVALGVRFTQAPRVTGPVTTAVLDDTCGNLIQIMAQNRDSERRRPVTRQRMSENDLDRRSLLGHRVALRELGTTGRR